MREGWDATEGHLLIWALQGLGNRPALVWGDRVLSGAALAGEISKWAQAWDAWGIAERTPVALLSSNRPEVALARTTAMVTGARWTSLHPLGSGDDHTHIVEDAGIDTLLFDPVHADRAAELQARVPTLRRAVALAPGAGVEDMATAATRFGTRRLRPPDLTADDPSLVVYTGGTTGRPKGVFHTQRTQTAVIQAQLAEWEWPADLRFLAATPMTHAAGAMLLPTLLRGGSVAVMDSFDPDELLATTARLRITATLLVPTMIYALLDHPRVASGDLASLETVVYGASAMSPARLAEAVERVGPVFFQIYGQAECPMTITVLRKHEHLVDDVNRLASCGRPIPWLDVRILDDDDQEVPAGETGEICARGPLVMIGYLNQPDVTAATLRNGWLRTGDLARVDDGGFLTIVDRSKDMIVTGGFNVFPREVEDVLTAHPAVASAAVIGVPDDKWGETVRAIVVPRPGHSVSEDELRAHVRARKGPVATPKVIELRETIPTTPVGKPDKRALRAEFWAGHARRVN